VADEKGARHGTDAHRGWESVLCVRRKSGCYAMVAVRGREEVRLPPGADERCADRRRDCARRVDGIGAVGKRECILWRGDEGSTCSVVVGALCEGEIPLAARRLRPTLRGEKKDPLAA
jgi:hypothetical protein